MANLRHGIPAGWQWREGKTRWVPSPTLRKAGWKGRDLKDGRGAWLARGASIEAAALVVQAVADWRAGLACPVALADTAPPGACAPQTEAAAALDPFSIGALLDAYLASNELLYRKNGDPRPRSTVRDYTKKLKRLVDALAGFAELPTETSPAYAAAVARVRAMSVFVLEPVEGPGGLVDPLHKAYWALRTKAGVNMAFGTLACASAWLAWCHRRQSRRIGNWARDVDRETPPGRIRPWTMPELAAMVVASETLARTARTEAARLCYLGTADAFILAIDLTWSQVDVLELVWPKIIKRDGRRVATGARQKTGLVGGTPFLSMGVRRLATIKRRQASLEVRPLRVIYLPRQRRHRNLAPEAQGGYLRDWFDEIRAEAARHLPSCAGLTFADTRDTGFTLGRQAGLNNSGIASRTRQSLANINQLSDRNYGQIGPEIADPAADLLDAYLEGQLKKHGVKL